MYLVTEEKTAPQTAPKAQASWRQHGVVGELIRFVGGGWSQSRRPAKKRMCVIETLMLGAKKQLLLVSCDGERFLVGTGPDQVQTIVRLGSELETQEAAVPAVAGEGV
jgi:flagellar biogenesis protein FliO